MRFLETSISRFAKLSSEVIAKNDAAHRDHIAVLWAVMSHDGMTVNQEPILHRLSLAVWANLLWVQGRRITIHRALPFHGCSDRSLQGLIHGIAFFKWVIRNQRYDKISQLMTKKPSLK